LDLWPPYLSSSWLVCSCPHGWELLFLAWENGLSRKCLLLAIFTLLLNKSVQQFPQVWIINSLPNIRFFWTWSLEINLFCRSELQRLQGSGHHKASTSWGICFRIYHIHCYSSWKHGRRGTVLCLCAYQPPLSWRYFPHQFEGYFET